MHARENPWSEDTLFDAAVGDLRRFLQHCDNILPINESSCNDTQSNEPNPFIERMRAADRVAEHERRLKKQEMIQNINHDIETLLPKSVLETLPLSKKSDKSSATDSHQLLFELEQLEKLSRITHKLRDGITR